MRTFQNYRADAERTTSAPMTLEEYFELCKKDPMAYATAAERMLKAIGPPRVVDTAKDKRLSRIFSNRTIRLYDTMSDFYGMEDTIEQVVGYFRHAAQGLEEKKQILYLLGPVGGGKSSLAERLKELMETYPIYVLADKDGNPSPVFETPLGLFEKESFQKEISEDYDIPRRYFGSIISPWAVKRLEEYDNDLSKFTVVRIYPSKLKQIAITKTEPGDENNQDISSLVGKVDIRQLEDYSQNESDAYSYSGGLNRAGQGLLEFVEMFKAPIKMLHPLLTATQEQNYVGTEAIGAIPFNGTIMAHCFSEDTELLTVGGWKTIDQVDETDSFATLNKDNGELQYQTARKKFVYDHVDEMYHMSSSSADHLVTGNHKMVYESYGTYKQVTAEEFFIKGAKVPVSGILRNRPDSDIYNDNLELRFHVWCVTDGNIHYKRADGTFNYRFIFKKQKKIDRLIGLLSDLDYDYTIRQWSNEATCIYVNGVNQKFTKQFNENHRYLSADQTSTMLIEWSHTDGSRSDNDNTFQLSTNVPFHRDLIQELATLSGHKTTCAISDKPGYNPVYMLNVRMYTTHVRSDLINKGTVSYSGRVWCVETPNHTVVARRNGKILITGNSNESEWQTFRSNKNNEAFLDRICVVTVPYSLRVDEEVQIYQKMIEASGLTNEPLAPKTLDMLAQFSVLSRLKEHENSTRLAKMKVYNGKNIKATDPNAKSIQEYHDVAGVNEGMDGLSTRFGYKVLSKTFNYDPDEISADPVHLMHILEESVRKEQFPKELNDLYISFIKETLTEQYLEFIGNEIQKAYLESYGDYGQNMFNRYLAYADNWIEDVEFKDPDTGVLMNRDTLNKELEKLEKPAGIPNPKDFREEVVKFCHRDKAKTGKDVEWTAYAKLRRVIEKTMFSKVEDLLPVISFGSKESKELEEKHDDFVGRMKSRGYTDKQTRRLCEWYMRVKKSG